MPGRTVFKAVAQGPAVFCCLKRVFSPFMDGLV